MMIVIRGLSCSLSLEVVGGAGEAAGRLQLLGKDQIESGRGAGGACLAACRAAAPEDEF